MVKESEMTIGLETIFASAFEKDPVQISAAIEGDLLNLINKEVLSEESTKIYVSERKGLNLFHPFFNKILEKHDLGSINLYKNLPLVRIKEFYVEKNNSILLTDKIEKEDVETICELLGSNTHISKVCGYFAQKEYIRELRERFQKTDFKFKYEVDVKGYNHAKEKLNSVYTSRIKLDSPVNEISANAEEDLSDLINKEILSEKATSIYIIDRNVIVLFHPFLNSLIEKHRVSSINKGKKYSIIQIGNAKNGNNKSILLTDAIGNGNEIRAILSNSKISISKVCGYLVKKRSLTKLKTEFPDTDFKFIHEVEDDKSYQEDLWRLTPVYHSRTEPLDPDHPFHLYLFTCKLEKNEIKQIIYNACKKLFLGDVFDHEDELRATNIMGYTIQSSDSYQYEGEILKGKKEFYEIERMQLRFRFDMLKSQLRVMAFCPVLIDVSYFSGDEVKCKKFLPNEYCKTGNKLNNNIYQTICPLCIDINISLDILNKIYNLIKDEIQMTNGLCQIHLVRNYSPFEDI